MIKNLIKMADTLDSLGLAKEANAIDDLIKSAAKSSPKKPNTKRHIAVSEVPADTLDDVMELGLLSGKVLLKHPDLLRKARPDAKERAEWIRDHKASLKKGEPIFKGPNAYIKPPPPTLRLSPNHPSRLHKLIRLEVDLDSLMKEIPETRIYGIELTPFPVTDDTWERMSKKEIEEMKKDIGNSRKRFLSMPELDELFSRSAEDLWAHYDRKSPLYAGDVPHIAIITPSGVVPPKFLRLAKG